MKYVQKIAGSLPSKVKVGHQGILTQEQDLVQLTGRGKANLRHCSLSFLDRSLNKGSVPRTVSSFKSTSTLLALPASTCLCTWKAMDIAGKKINREHHLESNTTMLSPHVWSHAWIGRFPSTAATFPSSHHLVTMQAFCKSKVTWTIQIKNSKIISTRPSTCWKWVHHGLVFPLPGIIASHCCEEKRRTQDLVTL